ncbi:cyclin-A1-1-like [Quillaja saponaria]|uniref:Cyclin-A1-1-like n=1 Tax=Quillaja saponaria TaxID=32244 RepID=A0AAD7PRG9_QUISA|nr:cyclin-A1-1-like [Quillaja saponaria]
MSSRNRYGKPKMSFFSENLSKKKTTFVKSQIEKKSSTLVDVTNQRNGPFTCGRASTSVPSKPMVPCASKVAKTKKDSVTCSQKEVISGETLPTSTTVKSSVLVTSKETPLKRRNQPEAADVIFPAQSSIDVVVPALSRIMCAPRRMDISPTSSFSGSVSLDKSTSTCDSLKSPEFEYIDYEDISAVKSIERRSSRSLKI